MTDRLRTGELLAAPSGALLLVALFLPWYRFPVAGDLDAWSSFTFVEIPLVAAGLAGLGLTWTTLTRASPALPVALGVWTVVLGALACSCVVVRLIAPLGTRIEAGAWLGLAGALLVTAAGWLALDDERPARGVPVVP